MNKAAMTTYVQICVWTHIFIFLREMPKEKGFLTLDIAVVGGDIL